MLHTTFTRGQSSQWFKKIVRGRQSHSILGTLFSTGLHSRWPPKQQPTSNIHQLNRDPSKQLSFAIGATIYFQTLGRPQYTTGSLCYFFTSLGLLKFWSGLYTDPTELYIVPFWHFHNMLPTLFKCLLIFEAMSTSYWSAVHLRQR